VLRTVVSRLKAAADRPAERRVAQRALRHLYRAAKDLV
jgi:hypothetical protein